jgi:hypothetical protein
MAKDQLLIVRVDAATKQRIEAAARRLGKSVTSFLLESAETAARKVEAMPEITASMMKPKGRGACPTFFLACCHEASKGGESNYGAAGHELMRHVVHLCDYAVEEDEWEARLDRLQALLDAQDDDGILAWFDRELPRCMALVPRRRRAQFLKGVLAMHEENDCQIQG